MNQMTPADRTAYLARRDAAIAAALDQVSTAAPDVIAEAGRRAQRDHDARQVALRAMGPSGVRKAELELVIQEGLAARAELDAIEAHEASEREEDRRIQEETASIAAVRAAKLSSRVAAYIRGKVRRSANR
jgi:hypothetical protein